MAIFPGKFISGTNLEFQSRVFLMPWVKKNFIRSCSKSSSFPVRYVPKKSLRTNDLQTTPPPIKLFVGKKTNPHTRHSDDEETRKHADQNARLPPQWSSEDKMHRLSNLNSLRVEVSDSGRGFVVGDISKDMAEIRDEKQSPNNYSTFHAKSGRSMPDDEETRKHADQNARLPPQWISEDKMHRLSNLNSLRVEVSDSGMGFVGGDISKDMSEIREEKQSPNNYSTFHAKLDMVEENHLKGGVGYKFMEEPTEADEELEIHHTEDAHEQFHVEVDKTRQEAEKVAVQILGARAFTAVKLKKKLLAEKFPPDIVDAVIADFRSRGFINDSLYAETFSRSRWSSSSWGPRRIKKALSEKGVNKADAEEAVKLIFEDGEAGDNQVSSLGFSKLSMDRLLSQASKQWLRGQNIPTEKRKARIIRWLQYRGFDWGVVSYVLKKLQSQNSP